LRALDEAVVRQAVDWYVRLASGRQTAQDHAEFARWHDAQPDRARAWRRLQAMGDQVQGVAGRVAPEVARATLAGAGGAPARRQAFKALIWVGAGATALYLVQDQVPWRSQLTSALADARTAAGERRSMMLADGTRLLLNTATAIDIRFDARERRIVLHRGEILVATARDAAGRPFVVATRDGTLTPIGTLFTARRDDDDDEGKGFTRLAVSEGAVQIRAADRMDDGPTLVRAGQQVRFTRVRIEPVARLQEASQSWTEGTLTAEGMALADFIAELSRYRAGRLRCAPDVAGLRITGAWPLDGDDPTDRILASLERQLPVKVTRLTRYWVTVGSR
jgi:transmembrane sensor